MTDEEVAAVCREWAEQFIKLIAERLEVSLGYERDSLVWVENYIERNRQTFAQMSSIEGTVNLIGAFLGECLIQRYGGHWCEHNRQWGIALAGEKSYYAFPFAKVEKQIREGLGDSVVSFYDVTNDLLQGKF